MMKHDIDEVSLFAQTCVTKIVSSLRTNFWDDDTQNIWATKGYQSVLTYCLEDSDHDLRYRQKAIEHCTGLLQATTAMYTTHLKNNNREEDLLEAQKQMRVSQFIIDCRKSESRIDKKMKK